MPRFFKRSGLLTLTAVLSTALATLAVLAVGAFLVAVSGNVEVAADGRTNGLVEWFLETARRRAVERQVAGVEVPALAGPARRRRGERLYRQHCAQCHGLVGEPRTAAADGLHPTPPDLSEGLPLHDAAEAWWITTHGIRMTGMPGFGERLSEEEIWDVVAWLTRVATDGTRPEPAQE